MKNGMTMGVVSRRGDPLFLYEKAFILLSNKPGCSFSDRQGSLRSLTAFPFYRFAMGDDGGLAPCPCLRDFIPQTPFFASRLWPVCI